MERTASARDRSGRARDGPDRANDGSNKARDRARGIEIGISLRINNARRTVLALLMECISFLLNHRFSSKALIFSICNLILLLSNSKHSHPTKNTI